jgi:hypothetical protein
LRRPQRGRDIIWGDRDASSGYATLSREIATKKRLHLDLAEAEDSALAGVEDFGGAEEGSERREIPFERERVPTRPPSFMAVFWRWLQRSQSSQRRSAPATRTPLASLERRRIAGTGDELVGTFRRRQRVSPCPHLI